MVSWALLNSLGLPVGIWLLRNGPAYYQSIRTSIAARKTSIRKVPTGVSHALNILFVSIVLALLYTLPYFSPSNLFQEAKANIQTPTEILFARISALRTLTSLDLALKSKLTSKNSRLMYLAYGPDVVGACTFCSTSDTTSYFYFALPSLLAPHLLHLAVLGLTTSPVLAGLEAARWRGYVFWAALIGAAADIYWHLNYDFNANSLTTSTKDLDFFFWNLRQLRTFSFVALDGLLASVMWLSSTNRFFFSPPTPSQQLDLVNNAIEGANYHLWATGIIRNTVNRDRELRSELVKYWDKEREIYESREVVNAVNSALERTDIQMLTRTAEQRTCGIIPSLGG